ncbi:hypothetical protein LINGRAHAP2_LOCUS22684, partial [Linum grandiflorum]
FLCFVWFFRNQKPIPSSFIYKLSSQFLIFFFASFANNFFLPLRLDFLLARPDFLFIVVVLFVKDICYFSLHISLFNCITVSLPSRCCSQILSCLLLSLALRPVPLLSPLHFRFSNPSTKTSSTKYASP